MSNLNKLINGLVDSPMKKQKQKQKQKNKNQKNRTNTFVNQQLKVPASGGVVTNRRRIPVIETIGESIIVSNCENAADITTNLLGTFGTTRRSFVPGTAFWINNVAANFSKYQWVNLEFIYIPSCPTTTPGTVVLSVGYDAGDAAPGSLSAAQRGFHSVTSPYWAGYDGSHNLGTVKSTQSGVRISVDTSRFDKPYYPYTTLTGFNGFSNTDRNIYSPGYLDISFLGGPAAATLVGSVFMKYTIKLIEPINPVDNT
nr:MAG: hypothetical protein 4 [Regressovirinae sp.]